MAGDDTRVLDIDRDGVTRIRDRINLAQGEFTRKAKELEAQLGTMRRDWVGDGGSAFGRLMAEWQERQHHVTSLLQQFEESLATTQQTSSQQDATAAANLFALNKSLNA